MKLFKKEKINKRIRSRYEIKGFEKELSMKLFELKELRLSKVIVTLEPEEMMPHKEIKVKNKEEFEKVTKNKGISSIGFMGKYNGHDLNILIDYDLSLLNILSCDEKTNENIKDILSISISDKKPIKTIRKTIRNTVMEYNIPTITDQKSSVNWIISVIEHPSLKIKNIALDDLSRSGDEGNSSTTINSEISEKDLLKICNKNDTDVISLTARFEGIPIIIGVDLRSYKPFITIRNQNPVNIELVEKELKINNH